MTELVLTRHGQTAWNIEEIFRGRTDVDLDATGLRQAELLADYLSNRKIEAVYSSPLQRALKTARAIASRHKLDVTVTEGLNDLSFGEWEGLPVTEVRKRYPAQFQKWLETPHLVKVPGGDSLDVVAARGIALVNEVMTRHTGTVVLVSHRVVHKVLILALLGLDNSRFWNIKLDTAAITTFAYESNRWVLTGHNDTSHLRLLQKRTLRDF